LWWRGLIRSKGAHTAAASTPTGVFFALEAAHHRDAHELPARGARPWYPGPLTRPWYTRLGGGPHTAPTPETPQLAMTSTPGTGPLKFHTYGLAETLSAHGPIHIASSGALWALVPDLLHTSASVENLRCARWPSRAALRGGEQHPKQLTSHQSVPPAPTWYTKCPPLQLAVRTPVCQAPWP
jgi:hypothetical protein